MLVEFQYHLLIFPAPMMLTQPPPQALRFSHGRGERETSDWWWTARDHGKGPSRLPLREHFHQKRDVWVRGRWPYTLSGTFIILQYWQQRKRHLIKIIHILSNSILVFLCCSLFQNVVGAPKKYPSCDQVNLFIKTGVLLCSYWNVIEKGDFMSFFIFYSRGFFISCFYL